MSVMRFKRFTKVGVLKGIGRELLGRFFGRFNGNGQALALPPASASDDEPVSVLSFYTFQQTPDAEAERPKGGRAIPTS